MERYIGGHTILLAVLVITLIFIADRIARFRSIFHRPAPPLLFPPPTEAEAAVQAACVMYAHGGCECPRCITDWFDDDKGTHGLMCSIDYHGPTEDGSLDLGIYAFPYDSQAQDTSQKATEGSPKRAPNTLDTVKASDTGTQSR